PLRAVDLVSTDAYQIDAFRPQIGQLFAKALSCVHVEERRMPLEDRRDLTDRLDHSGLVVYVHDRHGEGLWSQGALDGFRVHPAATSRWYEGDLKTLSCQGF